MGAHLLGPGLESMSPVLGVDSQPLSHQGSPKSSLQSAASGYQKVDTGTY